MQKINNCKLKIETDNNLINLLYLVKETVKLASLSHTLLRLGISIIV